MTTTDAVLELTRSLIQRHSVTPEDAGCQQLLADRLAALGFRIEPMRFGDVDNLWARRGETGPLLAFAGHTDVVPTGAPDTWRHDPFAATVEDGWLYGRGAADMKGSLAAMIVALETFLGTGPEPAGSIGVLLTSDEEGPAVDGTRRVVDTLQQRGERIDCCVVGEPSSRARLGDTVRIGRRGSLNGRLQVRGIQGHVAYPQDVRNPIHDAFPVLATLTARSWDEGNAHFPPTSLQVSNVRAGTGATNVVPGVFEADFNFRYAPVQTAQALQRAVADACDAAGLDYHIDWQLSGEPFYTAPGSFTDTVVGAVRTVCGVEPELNTGGGTSDGRFIAPTGADVVELGPVNATIHKIDERIEIAELGRLADTYAAVLRGVLGRG
jgi:succinyl-diaminopimelate desuccinylase